jgi:uncharacterized protein YukE
MSEGTFTVVNSAMNNVTDSLDAAVRAVLQILDQLNTTLAGLPAATSNSGVAPWQEQQNAWDSAATDMADQLTGLHLAAINTHEAYLAADSAVANLIGG